MEQNMNESDIIGYNQILIADSLLIRSCFVPVLYLQALRQHQKYSESIRCYRYFRAFLNLLIYLEGYRKRIRVILLTGLSENESVRGGCQPSELTVFICGSHIFGSSSALANRPPIASDNSQRKPKKNFFRGPRV